MPGSEPGEFDEDAFDEPESPRGNVGGLELDDEDTAAVMMQQGGGGTSYVLTEDDSHFGGKQVRVCEPTARLTAHRANELEQGQARSRHVGSGARDRARREMNTDSIGNADVLEVGVEGHDNGGRDDLDSVAGDESDRLASGSGNPDLTYQGFDGAKLKIAGEPIVLLPPTTHLWAALSGAQECRPVRAMRINCIAPFFRRDAEFFSQMQLPKGHESRAQATAALVSLMFAGTAMGLPSGKHEEQERNQQSANQQDEDAQGGAGAKDKGSKPLTRVQRYTYIPGIDQQDSYPMFQIGLEEIYNKDKTEVLAIGIWLFINDETHSTSNLMAKVMADTRALHDGVRASAQLASQRDKSGTAETSRHDKAGCGFADLGNNFEKNAGLQYKLVKGSDDLVRMLEMHSGRTTGKAGRPCVQDMAKHLDCAAGRRIFQGDSRNGYGGRHPLAPEWLFNAKTGAGLEFGLVGLDGELLDVCDEQMDPSHYWTPDGSGDFRVPQFEDGRDFFWMCTSYEARTPFALPLKRPLQGTVLPGNDLMRLFLDEERRHAASQLPGYEEDEEDEEDACDGADGLAAFDQSSYNRLRSIMTRKDQYQRDMDALLSNSNHAYDQMSPCGFEMSAHNPSADESKGEVNYTLRIVSMTELITKQTDRLWTAVVQKWQTRTEADLFKMQMRLEKANRLSARATGGDDDDDAMDVDYEEVGDEEVGDTWENLKNRRAAFQARLYNVKRDVVQYHARLLKSCFLSTKDSATLPAGYKAMHAALERGVNERGGSASIAFSGAGFSLRQNDRMVWGSLQEWLRQIFVDDCRVAGRDRRIMDEMYLTCFEMYHKNTFILIIASEKGCGKSVRAVRLMVLLPDGWCSKNSGTTARSWANGNNSPSNGTVILEDEMSSDMVQAECTEKMEATKTIVGEREIEIERTRSVKSVDGTEQHMTYKIVTDHKWCCNMGQLFTIGQDEPSPGKEALIQRTVCLQARAEATEDSPDKDFKANLHLPAVAQRVSDFRMFTSLVGWGLLMIKDLPWLQPDFAVANLIFKEGDKMLSKDYAMPSPEPRRLVKRLSNLTTMCMKESVARVYLFKQSASAYEAGRPTDDMHPPKFEIGDMWDVVRTLRPTREMILAAWSHSLEYSIGTSAHGVNVMDAICERLGFQIDKVFRKMYSQTAADLMPTDKDEGSEMESYMRGVSYETAGGSSVAIGADPKELDTMRKELSDSRASRSEFRRAAIGSTDAGGDPLSSIRSMVGDQKRATRFSGALFPSCRAVQCYYTTKAVLRWAAGHSIDKKELDAGGVGSGTGLPYKLKNGRRGAAATEGNDGDGGAKEYDHAWLVLSEASNKEGTGASWRACADKLKKSKMCSMFDMHSAGIADAVYMLSSNENKRPCPEMPTKLPFHITQSQAFHDEKGSALSRSSQTVQPAPYWTNQGNVPANEGEAVEARDINDPHHRSRVPIHEQIDLLHNRGRLPALMPHTSTRVENAAPVRWQTGSGIEVNATVVYEHTMNKMECILRCARVPGLRGLQENFISGGRAPACLRAENSDHGGVPVGLVQKTERVLPYAIDVSQMGWTVELAERFYHTGRGEAVLAFNERLESMGLLRTGVSDPLTEAALPELSLRYPGFPKVGGEPNLRLISIPVGDQAPADASKKVEISKANPLQTLDGELLRYQTEVAIGREATTNDIEDHRRSLIGSGYVWGVQGDVFDYVTWQSHLGASMVGRGNVDPALDESGGFIDKGFESVLDSELMLYERLVERRAVMGSMPEAKYNVGMSSGSTYRHLEEAARVASRSQLSGAKRSAPPSIRVHQLAGGQTFQDVMRNRYRAVGARTAQPSRGGDRSRRGGAGDRRQDSHDDED